MYNTINNQINRNSQHKQTTEPNEKQPNHKQKNKSACSPTRTSVMQSNHKQKSNMYQANNHAYTPKTKQANPNKPVINRKRKSRKGNLNHQNSQAQYQHY